MRILTITLLFLSSTIAFSQGNFYTSVDVDTIFSDGFPKFSVVMENGPGFKVLNVDLKDFEVAQGPSQFRRSHSSNGQRYEVKGLEYYLKPKKTGVLKIGKVKIEVNGKTLSSEEKKVIVIPKSKRKDSGPTYVTAETKDSTLYIGQQAVLKCNVYMNPKDKEYSPKEYYDLDLSDFYYQIQNNFTNSAVKTIIDYKEQYVLNDKTISLYPKSTGEFIVGPYSTYLQTRFFRRATGKLTSNSINYVVKELPPAPSQFIGGVGEYTLGCSFNNVSVKTNESLTLTLVLRGDGDPKLVEAPKLDLPDELEVYDPTLISEDQIVQNDRIVHNHIYEYLIIPNSPGNYSFTPSTVVFNPILEKYDTLVSKTLRFNCLKGTKSNNQSVTQFSERSDQMISFINNISASKKGKPFYSNVLFWIPIFLLLAAFPIIWFIQNRNSKRANIDPETLRFEKAKALALSRLKEAKKHLDLNNSRAFYEEISKSIYGYASDKLKVPSSQLNSFNINLKLESLGLSSVSISAVDEILKACELALFAGSGQTDKMQVTYDKSLNIIEKVEQQLYQH